VRELGLEPFSFHKEARERKRLRKGFGKEKLEEGKILEQK